MNWAFEFPTPRRPDRIVTLRVLQVLGRVLADARSAGLVERNVAKGVRARIGLTDREALHSDGLVLPAERAPLARLAADMTLRDYAARWLEQLELTLKPRSLENYRRMLDLHTLPELGDVAVAKLTRTQIRYLLSDALRRGTALQ